MKVLALSLLLFTLVPLAEAAPHAIPFEVRNGLVYIIADLDGHKLKLIVDSGASLTTVGCSVGPRVVSRMAVNTANGSSTADVVDVGMSLNGYLLRVHVLSGSFKFTEADGVLGNDVLSSFKSVSFNFKDKILTLEN